jgi:hypothetical protein
MTYRIYFRHRADSYYSVSGRDANEAVRNAKAVASKFDGVVRPVVTRIQRLYGTFERDLRIRS